MAAENSLEQFRKTQKEYQDRQRYLDELTQNQTPSLSDISNMVKQDIEYGKVAGDVKKLSANDNTEFTLTNPESKDARQVVNEYLQGKIAPPIQKTGPMSREELDKWMTKKSDDTLKGLSNIFALKGNAYTYIPEYESDKIQQLELDKWKPTGTILTPEQKAAGYSIDGDGKPVNPEENRRREAIDEGKSPDSISQKQAAPRKTGISSDKLGNIGDNSNKSKELDPLAQFQQLLKLQEEKQAKIDSELAAAQSQRDINNALGMITSGISKAAAGYGGGSVTQLKGDTSAEEILKQTADQKIADIKERMKTAGDTEKKVLERQLTLAQLQKMRDDKQAEADKLELGYAKIRSDERLAKAKAENPEPTADERKMYAEHRKILDEQIKVEPKFKELLKKTDTALELAKTYSKDNFAGTGIYSKLKSKTGSLSPKTQDLESALNDLSMENMVTMFAGFSKAIDSEGEREFYQKTQPEIGDDDSVLLRKLNQRREHVAQKLRDIQETKSTYTREGRFKKPEGSDYYAPEAKQTSGLGEIKTTSDGRKFKKTEAGWEEI